MKAVKTRYDFEMENDLKARLKAVIKIDNNSRRSVEVFNLTPI